MSLDLSRLAIDLAREGYLLYPDDLSLNKASEVLRKPEIKGRRPASGKKLKETYKWLKENAAQYHGKWVAVSAGKLLATGESAEEIKTKTAKLHPEYPVRKYDLASWTCEVAEAYGDRSLALEAAEAAFEEQPTLPLYQKLQSLAGDKRQRSEAIETRDTILPRRSGRYIPP